MERKTRAKTPEKLGAVGEFFDRLDVLRKEKKLTVRALEREAGLPLHTLTNQKGRGIEPGIFECVKIADVLGVSLDRLAGRPETVNAEYLEVIRQAVEDIKRGLTAGE